MKNKILIACIVSVIIILLPSTVAFNEIVNKDKLDKAKYLAIGFFPDIRGDWCIYYIIPGVIWATVHYDQLTIIWLGQFIIIGITSEKPEYGFGKIP